MNNFFQFAISNIRELFFGGLIVVSAIIVFLGALKKIIFDRIKNKLVRKIILALSSLALVFPAVMIEFWVDGLELFTAVYFYKCIIYAVMTIIVYWVYENTGCRDLIKFIGNQTIVKFIKVLAAAIVHGDEEQLKKDMKETETQAKSELESQIKQKYKDQELLNL